MGIGKQSDIDKINIHSFGLYNPNNFVLVFDTSKEPSNLQVSVPLGGTVNCTIFWGDGTNDRYTTTGFKTHVYEKPGVYIVQISGILTSLGDANYTASNTNNKQKLVGCLSFGNFGTTSVIFSNYINLITCPDNIPNYSIYITFIGCTLMNNSNIINWKSENLNSLRSTFSTTRFNQRIDHWNTSNVTDMFAVFNANSVFNQNISAFDTSKVTIMNYMFFNAGSFNQPIGLWNTNNVTAMDYMFGGAATFNQPLDNWNVRKVTNFSSMFQGATSFNSSLSGWAPGADTAATNCTNMFNGCTVFEGSGLQTWDTSKVTNMYGMFESCKKMPSPAVNNFNTSNSTTMQRMFYRSERSSDPANLSSWDISKVTNFANMFSENYNHRTIINNWIINSGISCNSMFYNHGFNGSLSGWQFLGNNDCSFMFGYNIAGVNDSTRWFTGSGLDSWNTSGIVNADSMMSECNFFNANLSNWNTSNITNMKSMFGTGFNGAYKFAGSGLQNWNTSKVTNMNSMFKKGVGAGGSEFRPSGIDNWNVTGVLDMANMFLNQQSVEVSLTGWNICNVTGIANFMNGCNIGSGNYSDLLIAWNNNKASGVNGVKSWATNLTPHFGTAKYMPSASAARAALVSYGWTITDGGAA